jgi:hypothetical protein
MSICCRHKLMSAKIIDKCVNIKHSFVLRLSLSTHHSEECFTYKLLILIGYNYVYTNQWQRIVGTYTKYCIREGFVWHPNEIMYFMQLLLKTEQLFAGLMCPFFLPKSINFITVTMKSQPSRPIMMQLNSVHIPVTYFFNICNGSSFLPFTIWVSQVASFYTRTVYQ